MLTDKTTAIIVAGGLGSRFESEIPKQFVLLNDKPVIVHTLKAFELCPHIHEIVLVVHENYFLHCENLIKEYSLIKIKTLCPSGSERYDSVNNALKHIDDTTKIICVHDGARPFIKQDIIEQTIEQVKQNNFDACLCAIKSKDTVKIRTKNKITTLDRENIFLAQTPQTFKASVLKKIYEYARQENLFARVKITDDTSLAEFYGHNIKIILSNSFNIKITVPEDLIIARAYLELTK